MEGEGGGKPSPVWIDTAKKKEGPDKRKKKKNTGKRGNWFGDLSQKKKREGRKGLTRRERGGRGKKKGKKKKKSLITGLGKKPPNPIGRSKSKKKKRGRKRMSTTFPFFNNAGRLKGKRIQSVGRKALKGKGRGKGGEKKK